MERRRCPTASGNVIIQLRRFRTMEVSSRSMASILFDESRHEWALADGSLLYVLGDPGGHSGPGRDLAWRHVSNYCRLLDELRAAFPDLIIENCTGGGGRIDLGMLRRTHTTWLSDNVNQRVRLGMFMAATSFLRRSSARTGWSSHPTIQ